MICLGLRGLIGGPGCDPEALFRETRKDHRLRLELLEYPANSQEATRADATFKGPVTIPCSARAREDMGFARHQGIDPR